MWLQHAKTAEQIDVLFGVKTLGGPRNLIHSFITFNSDATIHIHRDIQERNKSNIKAVTIKHNDKYSKHS